MTKPLSNDIREQLVSVVSITPAHATEVTTTDLGQRANAYRRASFDVRCAYKAQFAKSVPALWARNCNFLKLA
jgi:hypothetical protein